MIVRFNNSYLQKLFEDSPVTGKPKYSSDVITKFKKTILKLQFADEIRDIKAQRGLNFETLKGKMKEYYSVRVDYHYRLILTIDKKGTLNVSEIITIVDLTNHYQ